MIVSVVLVCLSIFEYGYRTVVTTNLIPCLFVALGFAIFLNIYSVWHFRKAHGETDQAFRNAASESSSIFHCVLDGVLIVDDDSTCLDTNPAACSILRLSRNALIGRNIRCFFPDSDAFSRRWKDFLLSRKQRGRVRLVAGEGSTLFVDFTAAANYLPGRHILILCDVTERTNAEMSLRKSEERFQHMANNIQEVFWMMDAGSQQITYVNQAYEILTGHSVESVEEKPSAYRDLIHPEDRIRVLSKLQDVATSGAFDEEFRFIRADGAVRWAGAKGFPARADGITRWIVGTAQDITSRKQAEMRIAEHLDAAETARAEAEALRKSTLALSQNLAMDSVLDTLLQCISELVPFDVATVIFVEDTTNLMIAREAPRVQPRRIGLTFKASESIFLERILFEHKAIILPDVTQETEWQATPPLNDIGSWLGVPLIAAGGVLGILSLGAYATSVFTAEHLRLAKSLSVSAAIAVNNARVHERAEIYASELEINLRELRTVKRALHCAGDSVSRSSNI
ncbi:MAG TPA: PAS domain S-box protein [Candidatus Acidoferrales bacterium]